MEGIVLPDVDALADPDNFENDRPAPVKRQARGAAMGASKRRRSAVVPQDLSQDRMDADLDLQSDAQTASSDDSALRELVAMMEATEELGIEQDDVANPDLQDDVANQDLQDDVANQDLQDDVANQDLQDDVANQDLLPATPLGLDDEDTGSDLNEAVKQYVHTPPNEAEQDAGSELNEAVKQYVHTPPIDDNELLNEDAEREGNEAVECVCFVKNPTDSEFKRRELRNRF